MPTVQHTDDDPKPSIDVVVVGEALVDIVVSPRGTVEHPGGSPANVAYGLGRLGADTALLTSIGDDHNIRPALLGSQFEAKTIFEELVPFTEVVKLSDEDALWLYPRLSLEDISKRILELGAGLVAVTMGAEGSLLTTGGTRVVVPSVKSAVVDTIGAGDSNMSALIYGLLMRGADGLAPSVRAQTTPIMIANFQTQLGLDSGPMTALAIHYPVPVIILTIILQRHIVAGLTLGAVKG